jgi:hypothetical protein
MVAPGRKYFAAFMTPFLESAVPDGDAQSPALSTEVPKILIERPAV